MSELAQVMHTHIYQATFARTADNAVVEWSREKLGENCDDIEAHGLLEPEFTAFHRLVCHSERSKVGRIPSSTTRGSVPAGRRGGRPRCGARQGQCACRFPWPAE